MFFAEFVLFFYLKSFLKFVIIVTINSRFIMVKGYSMKAKETLKKYLKRYFVDAMGSMALGLFASLLIGTIIGTLAGYVGKVEGLDWLATSMNAIAGAAKAATGMAIGVAIAYKLGAHPLVIFSSAAVGYLSNGMGAIFNDQSGVIIKWGASAGTNNASEIFYSAGPAGAFFAVIIAAEIGMLVSKKTKVDILVTPLVTLIVGFIASFVFCPAIAYIMYYLGTFITIATAWAPLIMGIILSVVMGVILTLPISSAAICAVIFSPQMQEQMASKGLEEAFLLAGGACVAGCCAQMVGFAVVSFRENKWGGIVSQGLGTSMLQMGNIVKKPVIWLAPTLAAAVVGPISTLVFELKCSGVSAGMGTCGMVGPIGVISSTEWTPMMWIGLLLVCIILPAILSFAFNEIFRKLGWIKTGDMQLDL